MSLINKQKNKKLLMMLVKAENSISDIWLTLEEDKQAFNHVPIDEIIKDIHLIRSKIAKSIGYEVIFEKQNVLED